MRLKILTQISKVFPKQPLHRTYIIACQHILPSTSYLFDSLLDLGIPPENIALFGKCYSTSNLARKMISRKGIYVSPESSYFDGHKSFDDYFTEKLQVFYRDTIKKWDLNSTCQLIIIDDGGELIKLANRDFYKYQKVWGVEQTSAGYHKLKDELIKFPIINVARSDAKLIYESPMIAEAQVNRIKDWLKDKNFSIKNLLILGNGFIGTSLARKLSSIYNVTRYDKDLSRTDILEEELQFENFDLIIGTTGTKVLPSSLHYLLKAPTTLISASSSDREFDAVYFRKKVSNILNCHQDILVNGINLLNCGFPINFRGKDEDSVPLEKIQLTIALLFAGVCQSLFLSSKPFLRGFMELDKGLQSLVLKSFNEINPKEIFI